MQDRLILCLGGKQSQHIDSELFIQSLSLSKHKVMQPRGFMLRVFVPEMKWGERLWTDSNLSVHPSITVHQESLAEFGQTSVEPVHTNRHMFNCSEVFGCWGIKPLILP